MIVTIIFYGQYTHEESIVSRNYDNPIYKDSDNGYAICFNDNVKEYRDRDSIITSKHKKEKKITFNEIKNAYGITKESLTPNTQLINNERDYYIVEYSFDMFSEYPHLISLIKIVDE